MNLPVLASMPITTSHSPAPNLLNNTAKVKQLPQVGQIVADDGIIYRKLLKITKKGYEVQNFYKDIPQKQTDPFFIKDVKQLSVFQAIEIYHLQNLIFDGPLTLWFPNNTKAISLFFKNGHAEGSFHKYYINGQLEIEGQYKTGQADGLWYYWNSDGGLIQKVYFKQGIRQWQKTMFNLKGS